MNQSYSGNVTLSGSNSLSDKYTLRFHYDGDNDYGASFDNISITNVSKATYSWTTNASNSNSGWSSTETEDITVTNSATTNHVGDYTLTVTDANNCQSSTVSVTAGPTISASESFSTFTSCSGFVSTEQSFTLSAINLSDDLTVTAPTGYEVCKTSGGSYTNTLTYTPTAGAVASTTAYVRLKSTASNGASGNIELTSPSATQVDLATGSATVNANPTISSQPSSGSDVCEGGSPSAMSVTPTGGTGSYILSVVFKWFK